MSPDVAKAIASLLVSIMSFLGWSPSDYAGYLPQAVRSQIIFEFPPAETASPEAPEKVSNSPLEGSTAPVSPPDRQSAGRDVIQHPPSADTSPFKKVEEPMPQAPAPSQAPPSPIIILPPANLSVEENISRSVINILCSMQRGNIIQKFTGSGVVIDPAGIILTNAHVAEHVMLEQAGFERCDIRASSPAKNSYKAEVVYLPDIWIQNNKSNLAMQAITGTGENDYALLILTERTRQDAPDTPLPYLAPSDKAAQLGEQITLAGYPASFGDAALLESALYLLQKRSQITSVLGFGGSGADVLTTSPTPLAEHGSSGGAVAGSDGALLGIIVATSFDSYTGGKNIQAITLPYIKKSIQNNSGKSFEYFLSNARSEADNFEKNKAASLSAMLMQGM